MKSCISGSGCRPFLPVSGAERSRSRCAKSAPLMCPFSYSSWPEPGLARSCRQSKIFQAARWAAAVHAALDVAVLDRRLEIGRLLGFDELALEQDDLFRVVELDHVGGELRRARNEVGDDEHVRVPLEGEARIVKRPERAVLR